MRIWKRLIEGWIWDIFWTRIDKGEGWVWTARNTIVPSINSSTQRDRDIFLGRWYWWGKMLEGEGGVYIGSFVEGGGWLVRCQMPSILYIFVGYYAVLKRQWINIIYIFFCIICTYAWFDCAMISIQIRTSWTKKPIVSSTRTHEEIFLVYL